MSNGLTFDGFEVYGSDDDGYRWRASYGGNARLATSAESYGTRQLCERVVAALEADPEIQTRIVAYQEAATLATRNLAVVLTTRRALQDALNDVAGRLREELRGG